MIYGIDISHANGPQDFHALLADAESKGTPISFVILKATENKKKK